MKKSILFALTLSCAGAFAQEHFAGINTSRRIGLLNASINPAELANMANDHEISVFNVSANVANNKISFGEIVSGTDFEKLIFDGGDAANLRLDVEILGPGFGMKVDKWAFAITSAAKIKANLVEVDVILGKALTEGGTNIVEQFSQINAQYNQRASATSWGEIGLSAAREIYDSEEHRFTGGVTFKLLFPGSYANMGADKFSGRVVNNTNEDLQLTDASANINIAYSGSLAEGFTDSDNFTDFFAGGLNGFATDLGINYQWKDLDSKGYKLNAGLAVRNLGSMTFKDSNNQSRNYNLNVPDGQFLDLGQFTDVEDLRELEALLLSSPYFEAMSAQRDFKVRLPALFSGYADYKLHNNFYVTAFTQQKLNEDSANDQIVVQNIISVTPRYSADIYEAYLPLAHNEISGFTAGVGFRAGGFFIGSGSVISAMLSDTNQADAYVGFRFGF
ncbi:MAG: hypothetical protein EOO45_06195 [Flavobacterium sp.]|nr:MAG: hypothetical protein EOO45_06195 [Flavobacterium sp.]